MLIKNNAHNNLLVCNEKQHFGLRKLSIGVVSVALGTTLMALTNTDNVHAATQNWGGEC